MARMNAGRAVLAVGLLTGLALESGQARSCESLTALKLPGAQVELAAAVAAGPLLLEGVAKQGGEVPGFCRVRLVARPVADSEIRIEVWLPSAESWNGRFLSTGNGGYSGALGYGEMEKALRQGYATAGSDTGHGGGDLHFGVGHPEKINDWSWRAVHEMTEAAKLVEHAYYGRFPDYAYFSGCSTGGHQALMEAQRFPEDYDGILAGAPGNNRIRLNVGFLWSWLALRQGGGEPLPASKLPLLNRAVVEACDALDGVKDGLIADPRRCPFDPASLQCRGEDEPGCLTAGQVAAVRAIYDGARNRRTGERLFAGWARGSEAPAGNPNAGWAGYFVGKSEPARADFWRLWVFHDESWDPRSFDFDRDVAYADRKLASIGAVDPNLVAFRKRNGKLLVYHGWADAIAPAEDAIGYYESVQRTLGGASATATFFRLFLAPGMGHCGGGPGPNSFDGLGALDRWVRSGVAPERIVASHSTNGRVDRTRPLCPYPSVAHWNGQGNPDDESQWACAAADRTGR